MKASDLNADVWAGFMRSCRFAFGDHVCERHHADRGGKVVGFYSGRSASIGVVFETRAGVPMNAAQDDLVLVKSGMDLPR